MPVTVSVMKNSAPSLAQRFSNVFYGCLEKIHNVLVSRDEDDLQYLVNSFNAGRDVSFGALVLSQEGICSNDDIIPWRALRSYRYENRELVLVRQYGNQFSSVRISAGQLKNMAILLHLIEQGRLQQAKVLSR